MSNSPHVVTTQSYGIYIHSPWCKYKCPYCSFNVYVDSNPKHEIWKAAILRDWERVAHHFVGATSSLYFGGGTPSNLPIPILSEIIQALPLTKETEVTVEVNPDDVTEYYFSNLKEIGVNRISLGVQSFQAHALSFLGRRHKESELFQIVDWLKNSQIETWSMDLIFSLPEHVNHDIRIDLDHIRRISPPHVSLYGLTIEPDTPFNKMVTTHKWRPLNDKKWLFQYQTIVQTLNDMGLERYEVSNFARQGHHSQHNESIWNGGYYAGLGPGAHGFLPNNCRSVQHSDWGNWLKDKIKSLETPSKTQALTDFLITRLRHKDGFPLEEIYQFGYVLPESILIDYVEAQLLETKDGFIRLGKLGWTVADALSNRLLESIHPLD